MKYFLTFIFVFSILISSAQKKKILDHADFDHWNKINNTQFSNNGKWIIYQLKPGYGDPTLKVTNEKGNDELTYLKGEKVPVWMEKGVPAIEKGINKGYELIGK